MRKLAQNDYEKVVAYYAAGHTQAETGRRFGVSKLLVCQIVKRSPDWTRGRGGSPPGAGPATAFEKFRISPAEKKALRKGAKQAGVSVSAFIRLALTAYISRLGT